MFVRPRPAIAPIILIILDGFGLGDPSDPGNAITPKTAPNFFSYFHQHSSTILAAHGQAVGLFPGQEGNSEAGHFNIGAGRVVEQDVVRIWRAVCDGTFFKNEAFKQAVYHAKKYQTAVHVMGLLTDDESAHAHPEDLYALLEFLRRHHREAVYIHLFTDGRDSPPRSAPRFLRELREHLQPHEQIATIMGRFYAMDRNKIWARTRAAYAAIVNGRAPFTAGSAEEAIAAAYQRGETDEYIQPTIILENGQLAATVQDNDAVFFYNNRSDRARQITKAFVQADFETHNPGAFKREKVPDNIRFVAMTDFGPDLPGIFTAFPAPDIPHCLAKAIGKSYRQLYISESEKYAHVTYFLNGGYAQPINGEERELVASGDTYTYADKPEMHAAEVTSRVLAHLARNRYNFVCINFPNADMVGHTGNVEAAKRAVAAIDSELERLVRAVVPSGGQVIITADHGNAEEMIDVRTGQMLTEHTTNAVPLVIIRDGEKMTLREGGKLCDVAPTLLKLMGIEQPKEMTGTSLF